ncbi:hypothetical protein D3C84_823440 [compost metagenome]
MPSAVISTLVSRPTVEPSWVNLLTSNGEAYWVTVPSLSSISWVPSAPLLMMPAPGVPSGSVLMMAGVVGVCILPEASKVTRALRGAWLRPVAMVVAVPPTTSMGLSPSYMYMRQAVGLAGWVRFAGSASLTKYWVMVCGSPRES